MKPCWPCLLVVGVVGCGRLPATVTPPPAPPPSPSSLQEAQPAAEPDKVTLLVQDLAEVKVQVGDFVVKGQVLSDRPDLRQNLEKQQEQLLSELAGLESPALQAPTSTLRLGAEQQQAEARVQQATQALQRAETALADFRDQLPWTEYALATLPLPEEQLKLETLQANVAAARAELQQATATLQQLQSAAATLNRVTERQAAETSRNQQRLQAVKDRLAQIESQLAALEPIYSPITGIVVAVTPTAQPPDLQVVISIEPESFAVPPNLLGGRVLDTPP